MGRKVKVAIGVAAIFLLVAASFILHISRDVLVSPAADSRPAPYLSSNTLSHPIDRLPNYALREPLRSLLRLRPPPAADSVLLPDWDVLLLRFSNAKASAGSAVGPLSCLFHTGATSPARPAGPSNFRCTLPVSLRRARPFYTPRLTGPFSSAASHRETPREIMRYTRIAYESTSTPDDVVVFAKGINRQRGAATHPIQGLRCVFSPASGGAVVAATFVTSSAQEIFRCPHPVSVNLSAAGSLRVSLGTGPHATPIPTVADYLPPRGASTARGPRSSICACTMLYNASKFLPEWVAYHAGVGMERFFLYDNGSDDELDKVASRLASEGFNVSTRFWPWPKTQEAGFSHCALVNRDACDWMAFLDVDEFVFSLSWASSDRPNKSMMGSLLSVPPQVGQVSIKCLEFGPSGLLAHPRRGVTQGYTCRRRMDARHKSLVRLRAIDNSLVNSIHHFELANGFHTKWVSIKIVRVNHYKYQAWEEFKVKFRRRVSTYVTDWKETTNAMSKDRTPGLGFEPIEPNDWIQMFCDVHDPQLKKITQKWFSVAGSNGSNRMIWEN